MTSPSLKLEHLGKANFQLPSYKLHFAAQRGSCTPEANPHAEVFQFAVLTVGTFLNHHYSKREKQPPQQILRDLVRILTAGEGELAIRKWITSNFD